MLKNYFTTMIRNTLRQKTYSFLNIFGLAFGLASVVIVFLYIQYEFSFDTYHENSDRIYKVVSEYSGSSFRGTNRFGITPAPLAPALMEEFPEIEAATRIDEMDDILIRTGNKLFFEQSWFWVDRYVFDVFTFPLLLGDEKTALSNPNSVIISERIAIKYFDGENPVGKILNVNNNEDFIVTAVMKNIPKNSLFKSDFFASYETKGNINNEMNNWTKLAYHTFILLQTGYNPLELEKKYPAFLENKLGDFDWFNRENTSRFYHQRMTDIHLRADTIFNLGQISDIKYIYIYSIIVLFILIISCINYINLSTARSIKRAQEVAVRKVVGARRTQLIFQFLGESLFLAYAALGISLIIAYLLLPAFNNLVERNLSLSLFTNSGYLFTLIAFGFIVGLLSGVYPALFVSSFIPVKTLRGSFTAKTKGIRLRNVLVVVQFAVSIFLIICTLVISSQVSYVRNKKLGFSKDHIIYVRIRDDAISDNSNLVKEALLANPGIDKVTFSSSLPMNVGGKVSLQYEKEGDRDTGNLLAYYLQVDYDYIDLFEMEIVLGRNFSGEIDNSANRYILNETAVELLGGNDPIGRQFGTANSLGPVVGVVKDFHHTNMHLPTEPVVLVLRPDDGNYMSVKLTTQNVQESISAIETVWNTFSSGFPFDYKFMDEGYDEMYKTEIRLGETFSYFSIIAILIACLGLFGLSALMSEQRTKEIGIHKVLGAPLLSILVLLSKDFIKLVLIANLIALPLGYYAMNKWLEDFAYRIEIGPGNFIFAALIAFAIAVVTVSYQAVKSALGNPVNALRHE